MPTQQKTVVISDVHLSNGASYSWFRDANAKRLTKRLTTFASDSTMGELVLLGDLFDLWLYPVNEVPYTVPQIIQANKPVVEALREFLKQNKTVYYMNGNHDMGVTQQDLDLLSGDAGKILKTNPEEYGQLHPGWHLEHGHAADMFNAPDDSDDTIGGYPLGYFITRLVATADNQGTAWNMLQSLYERLANMLEAFEPPESAVALRAIAPQRFVVRSFGSFLVDMIVKCLEPLAEVQDETRIRFAEPELDDRHITVGDVRTKYGSLLERWYDKYPLGKLLRAMLATNDLGWYAEDLIAANPGLKVVVMGHTHASVSGSLYDNDGCWCAAESLGHGDENPTYVEIHGDKGTVVPWGQHPAPPKP